jgi:hypothetical protein
MADVTPTGNISLPVNHVRAILSLSATWQAWCGVGNAAASLPFIHVGTYEPGESESWPCAIVYPVEYENERRAVQSRSEFPVIELRFVNEITAAYQADGQEANALYEFTNKIGAILAELDAIESTTQSGVGVCRMRRHGWTTPPQRLEPKHRVTGRDVYEVVYEIEVA